MPSPQFVHSIAANISFWRSKAQQPVDQKLRDLDNDRQNLFRAVDFGMRLKETRPETARLILECYELVLYMGYYQEWLPVLEQILEKCPNECLEVRIQVYNQLGNLYRAIRDFDAAMLNHEREEALARQLNKPLFLARANANLGKSYYLIRHQDEAEVKALAALNYFKQNKQCTENYASMLNLLGLINQARGDLEVAEGWFRLSVEIFRQTDLTIELSTVLRNLAIVLESNGNSEAALKFYLETEALLEPTRFETEKSNLYLSMGTLFFNLGDLQKAEANYLKAYSPYMVETGPLYTLATISNNLGNAYYAQGRLADAEIWLVKSIDTFRQANAHLMLANSMATLARTLLDQGELDRIEPLLNEARTIIDDYPGDAFAESIRRELSLVQTL